MNSKMYKINSTQLLLFLFAVGLFLPTYNNIFALYMLFVGGIGLITSKVWFKRIPGYFLIYMLIYISCYFIHLNSSTVVDSMVFIISTAVCFLFITSRCNTNDKVDYLLKTILLVGAVYAIFGIFESLTSTNIFDVTFGRTPTKDVSTVRFGLTRNRGLCSHSINNGMLLFHVLGIALYKVYGRQNATRTEKVCMFLIFADLLLTLGRAVVVISIVTYIVVVLLLMDDRVKRSRLTKRILISIPIMLFAIALLYRVRPEVINQILSFFSSITVSSTAYNRDNLGNFSHRVLLWGWVYNAVKNDIFFGVGFTTGFAHKLTEYSTKTSIEVHWLYLLFQRGLYGLSGFIILQIGTIRDFIKTRKRILGDYERLLKVEIVIIPMYFVLLFNCSGFEDLRFLYLEIALLYAIKRIVKRDPSKKQ